MGYLFGKTPESQIGKNSDYGVFPNENPIIFDFHLEKWSFSIFSPNKIEKSEFLNMAISSQIDLNWALIRDFKFFHLQKSQKNPIIRFHLQKTP